MLLTMDRPSVLVVEDNEIQRKVISLLAEEFGYDAVLAASCAEACDLFATATGKFRVVLMDFRLPDLNGAECSVCIRNIVRSNTNTSAPTALHRLPIVAMTGYVDMHSRERCLAAGFDDCLIKPFSSRELRDVLERWAPKESNVISFATRAEQSG